MFDMLSAISPPLVSFSFASTFAPYEHQSVHKPHRSVSLPLAPLSAPASLGAKSRGGAAKPTVPGVVNASVQQMESVLTDMYSLLHRVKDLQDDIGEPLSSDDDDDDDDEESSEEASSEGELIASADALSTSKRPHRFY